MFYKYAKRIFDIFFSLTGMLILFPVLLLLCIFCSADTGASPFFLQDRIGKDSSVFKIIKFRTMKKSAPDKTPARDISESKNFISSFGKWMRRSGADELPQLVNIFLGQMSFIGPRPLMLTEKVLHREREELGVYKVRPGITGIAQLKCESIGSVKEKAMLDAEYAQNITFTGDLKIIFFTILMLIKGKHIDEHFHSPSE